MEYLLGIDGGGTGTKIAVSDLKGNILEHGSAGALNGNGQSAGSLQETVAQIAGAVSVCGYEPGQCAGIGAGVAGISNRMSKETVLSLFAGQGFACPVRLYGDHETALAAVFPEGQGVALIAGTGSICYGRRADGQDFRVGGWGHLIDDGGSAYAIGRDILSAIVRQEDGRGERTVLRELVFAYLQITEVKELIGYLYHPDRSKKDTASLAVLLDRAVRQGDGAAQAIEDTCVEELTKLALTAMRHLDGEKKLALGGSVLLKNERIRTRLCRRLQEADSRIRIADDVQDASLGALRLLQEERGLHPAVHEAVASEQTGDAGKEGGERS